VELSELEVYRIAKELSSMAWDIYKEMKNEFRFSMGQQFIRAVDSIGANIAEGYGRYHYLDSVKFYYNARGSLWESKHWVCLLYERELLSLASYKAILEKLDILGVKLNNFISSIKSKAKINNK